MDYPAKPKSLATRVVQELSSVVTDWIPLPDKPGQTIDVTWKNSMEKQSKTPDFESKARNITHGPCFMNATFIQKREERVSSAGLVLMHGNLNVTSSE
ncbi:hypothetical protein PABG_11989 [Paracoccidioides brasiliensis Pb03]|nr:hypothetical protein PABG_11989 [Paracoccidioides brasiliensis Pb03]